jgi:hypothetical protein
MVERHIIGSVLVVALCACASVSQQARLTSAQVIRVADAQARSQLHERFAQFHRSAPRYDSHRRVWSVIYAGASGSAPSGLDIEIADATGQTQISYIDAF